MCMFNLVVANYANVQLNGKNAFIKGTCTSAQTALLNKREASTSKPFLPSIPALYIAASYGNVTGTYSFSGGPTGSLKINLVNMNVFSCNTPNVLPYYVVHINVVMNGTIFSICFDRVKRISRNSYTSDEMGINLRNMVLKLPAAFIFL